MVFFLLYMLIYQDCHLTAKPLKTGWGSDESQLLKWECLSSQLLRNSTVSCAMQSLPILV